VLPSQEGKRWDLKDCRADLAGDKEEDGGEKRKEKGGELRRDKAEERKEERREDILEKTGEKREKRAKMHRSV
jgi:hypothetical protein